MQMFEAHLQDKILGKDFVHRMIPQNSSCFSVERDVLVTKQSAKSSNSGEIQQSILNMIVLAAVDHF